MSERSAAKKIRMSMVAGALGASALLAACGGSKGTTTPADAQQSVHSAVSKLGAQSDVKMVLSLPITAQQAQQLSTANGGKPISTAEADAIHSGSIFLNVATGAGEPLDSPQARTDAKDSLDLGLTIAGNTPLEIVYSGGNLYARLQASQLLTDVGQDPTKAQKFTQQLSSLETYVPGITHLGAGDWVEVDHAGLQSLAPLMKQIGSQSGTSVDPATLKTDLVSLPSVLVSAVETSSTFASTGSHQYTATVQVAKLLSALKSDIQAANIPALGAQIVSALDKAQTKVPAGQTAVIDLQTTSSGVLSQAQVDLKQFAQTKVDFQVPLQLAFSSPGAPQAPAGATVLNVSQLPTLIGALLGGKSAGG